MKCPKCGSEHVSVQAISETTTKGKTKGFGCIKAFIGWLFFALPGLLCGLCGAGKSRIKTTTRTRTVRVCQNCGNRF